MYNIDKKQQDRLVLAYRPLVRKIARRYAGFGLPMPDLVSEGTIGLIKAVQNFDSERGTTLATYAMVLIRAHIHQYIISNWSIVKIGTNKADKKEFFKESSTFARDTGISNDNYECFGVDAKIEDTIIISETRKRFKQLMRNFFKKITPREKAIFVGRRLKKTPDTLEVLSLRFGLSKERIRQIENDLYERLQLEAKAA